MPILNWSPHVMLSCSKLLSSYKNVLFLHMSRLFSQSSINKKKVVGFVGIGAMGWPMANNINKKKNDINVSEVRVLSRSQARADAHAKAFGTIPFSDPIRFFRGLDTVVSCVPASPNVEEIVDMVLPSLGSHSNLLWIDCTTGDPAVTKKIASKLNSIGARMVDAPVSGGPRGAAAGTLTTMIGAHCDADANEASNILKTFAAKIVRIADVGSGHAVKAVNNMLLAANMWAAAEGLLALKHAGVPLKRGIDAIRESSGGSSVLHLRFPDMILTRKFDYGFSLGMMVKDMSIAQSISDMYGLSSPILKKTLDHYEEALAMFGPTVDHTEVVRLLERNAKERVVCYKTPPTDEDDDVHEFKEFLRGMEESTS